MGEGFNSMNLLLRDSKEKLIQRLVRKREYKNLFEVSLVKAIKAGPHLWK